MYKRPVTRVQILSSYTTDYPAGKTHLPVAWGANTLSRSASTAQGTSHIWFQQMRQRYHAWWQLLGDAPWYAGAKQAVAARAGCPHTRAHAAEQMYNAAMARCLGYVCAPVNEAYARRHGYEWRCPVLAPDVAREIIAPRPHCTWLKVRGFRVAGSPRVL